MSKTSAAIVAAVAVLLTIIPACAPPPPAQPVSNVSFSKWRHDGNGNGQFITVSWVRGAGAGDIDVVTTQHGRAGRRYAAKKGTSVEISLPVNGPLHVAFAKANTMNTHTAVLVESPLQWRSTKDSQIVGHCGGYPTGPEGRKLLVDAHRHAKTLALIGAGVVVLNNMPNIDGVKLNDVIGNAVKYGVALLNPIDDTKVVSALYQHGIGTYLRSRDAFTICREQR